MVHGRGRENWRCVAAPFNRASRGNASATTTNMKRTIGQSSGKSGAALLPLSGMHRTVLIASLGWKNLTGPLGHPQKRNELSVSTNKAET